MARAVERGELPPRHPASACLPHLPLTHTFIKDNPTNRAFLDQYIEAVTVFRDPERPSAVIHPTR